MRLGQSCRRWLVFALIDPPPTKHPILSLVGSSRQPRLATLAGVTSLAAGISTSLLRETRLASTAAGFLVATSCKQE